MAHIYTRRGDRGDTGLVGGGRVSKASARVEAYGSVDEASAAVGLARAACPDDERLSEFLAFLQHRLYNCSSSLATPAESVTDTTPSISAEDVVFLESVVDVFFAEAGHLREAFVLPAGGELSARLHLARTAVRLAERRADSLGQEEPVDELVLKFLNRSSDALYASARYAAARWGKDEEWNPQTETPTL